MKLLYQTNVPLGASTQYIGAWQNAGDGPTAFGSNAGQYVRITAYSDQPGTLALYQADSQSGLFNAQSQIVDQVLASGGSLATIEAVVTAQYWQAIYTNGPTTQAQFQHYAFGTGDLSAALLQQLKLINQQLLGLRGPKDSTKWDTFAGIR